MTMVQDVSPQLVQEEMNTTTREVLSFVELNKVLVTDLATLARAREVRVEIGARQKQIADQLARPKSWAHSLHQWFCTLERAALAPLTNLDNFEKEQIRAFNDEQTRQREARERELAEARRLADEARATAEAAALERAGEHQLAAAVVAEQLAAPPPMVILPNDVKAAGQTFRRRWTFEVVIESEVPRDFMTIDTVKLGRYASAMKGSGQVPGVRFFSIDDPIR
ncbi:MAG TPA: hypothetical protein VNN80_36360 [Polyangiaceae bacterium]|nr:hypothetical protein [Polyangiaceae bacterium]